jgi:hypothetical protein
MPRAMALVALGVSSPDCADELDHLEGKKWFDHYFITI